MQAMDSAQSQLIQITERVRAAAADAVSLKLKRLEQRLGCRLVERTPRHVQLSAWGSDFLPHARELLQAHERALALASSTRQRLTLGISDHVAGPELPALIARMNAQDPQLLIDIRIASSGPLLQGFDRREYDTVIVRTHAGRDDGELLAEEPFGWFAAPGARILRDDGSLVLGNPPGDPAAGAAP
jgi:DNA-binding transcriptional LysR family regulator